jgi:hypothetical protein
MFTSRPESGESLPVFKAEEIPPGLLTLNGISERLTIPKPTLWLWVKEGTLVPLGRVRTGGRGQPALLFSVEAARELRGWRNDVEGAYASRVWLWLEGPGQRGFDEAISDTLELERYVGAAIREWFRRTYDEQLKNQGNIADQWNPATKTMEARQPGVTIPYTVWSNLTARLIRDDGMANTSSYGDADAFLDRVEEKSGDVLDAWLAGVMFGLDTDIRENLAPAPGWMAQADRPNLDRHATERLEGKPVLNGADRKASIKAAAFASAKEKLGIPSAAPAIESGLQAVLDSGVTLRDVMMMFEPEPDRSRIAYYLRKLPGQLDQPHPDWPAIRQRWQCVCASKSPALIDIRRQARRHHPALSIALLAATTITPKLAAWADETLTMLEATSATA